MRLLIVEDEAIIARDLASTVESFGHKVVGLVDSGETALALAAEARPDLVLMDIHLSGALDGIATAEQLQARLHLPVLYLSAHADEATMRRAAATAPAGYLLKPFNERALWSTLAVAAHQQQLQQQLQASEARFATTLLSLGDAVVVTDLEGRITFANPVAARLCGLDPASLVGRPLNAVLTLVDAETRQPLPDLVAQVLAANVPFLLTATTLLLAHDGQEWPIEDSAAPIVDEVGQVMGMVIVFREIRARRAAEHAQREAEAALRRSHAQLAASLAELEHRAAELAVLSELGGALMRCATLDEGYVLVTRAAQLLFPEVAGTLFVPRPGVAALEAVLAWGEVAHPYPPLPEHDCRALCQRRIVLGEEPCGGCQCGAVPPALSRAALCVPLMVEGETLGVLHVHLPVTEQTEPLQTTRRQLALTFAKQAALGLANVRLRAVLQEQAARDPLTGLFNRRYLEETLVRELHRASRASYPVGVIMLDVDHFKRINDTYGHEAGDTVLRVIGQQLSASVRAGDVACRYGGEEFVLILPAAALEVVAARAEAIRQMIRALAITYHGTTLPPLTVSLGVTVVADDQASVTEALARADAALYAAKRAGRDRVITLTAEPAPTA
ncbi:MAG: diguanylate cyclase [Chloroflexales bacterium]|nr:diguanylate cyclase [Chloroflexales bacterium]